MPLIVAPPEPLPKSVMRDGGSPRDDEAYLRWREGLVETANREWIDRWFPHLPYRELIEHWELDEALYLATGGSRMFWSESENWHHRLRWLALELKASPRRMHILAQRIIDARRTADAIRR